MFLQPLRRARLRNRAALLAFGSLNLLKGCLCLAVTDALKSKQRWDDTIMIVSAGARLPILYRPHAARLDWP